MIGAYRMCNMLDLACCLYLVAVSGTLVSHANAADVVVV